MPVDYFRDMGYISGPGARQKKLRPGDPYGMSPSPPPAPAAVMTTERAVASGDTRGDAGGDRRPIQTQMFDPWRPKVDKGLSRPVQGGDLVGGSPLLAQYLAAGSLGKKQRFEGGAFGTVGRRDLGGIEGAIGAQQRGRENYMSGGELDLSTGLAAVLGDFLRPAIGTTERAPVTRGITGTVAGPGGGTTQRAVGVGGAGLPNHIVARGRFLSNARAELDKAARGRAGGAPRIPDPVKQQVDALWQGWANEYGELQRQRDSGEVTPKNAKRAEEDLKDRIRGELDALGVDMEVGGLFSGFRQTYGTYG